MGPIIILDKSSLQALSKNELILLNKYYFVNIPPVLPIEILADLKKIKDGETLNEDEVKEIANKLIQKDNALNVHYQSLNISSLMGVEYINERRPAVGGGKRVIDKDGRTGVHFTETPEMSAIRNWQKGNFNDAEKSLAENWRHFSKGYNLEEAKKHWKELYSSVPKCDNFTQLNEQAETFLNNEKIQSNLLTTLLETIRIEPKLASQIYCRWESGDHKFISSVTNRRPTYDMQSLSF